MAEKKHGRRAADTRVKTPLTELTEAMSANYGVVGRRAAVVAAAGGLLVTATLPVVGNGDGEVTAEQEQQKQDDQAPEEFVAQAAAAVPAAADDAPAVVGAPKVENVTATKAPEPEPEPEPTAAAASATSSNSGSSNSGSSDSGSKKKSEGDKAPAELPDGSKAQQVIAIAKQYTGVPYVSGGTTPSGWDCSGYTSFVFKQVGVNLPRTSGAQRNAGRVVSASEARPGDLVWHPGHVGIYAGNGMMYDAGSSRSGTSYRSHSWMGAVTYIRVL